MLCIKRNPSFTLIRNKIKIEYISGGQSSPFEFVFGVMWNHLLKPLVSWISLSELDAKPDSKARGGSLNFGLKLVKLKLNQKLETMMQNHKNEEKQLNNMKKLKVWIFIPCQISPMLPYIYPSLFLLWSFISCCFIICNDVGWINLNYLICNFICLEEWPTSKD